MKWLAFSKSHGRDLRSRPFACLCVALVTLLSASCGEPNEAAVNILAQPYIKPVYESIIKDFTRAHPDLSAQFTTGPREEEQMVQQLLRTQLIGGALPDVVFVSGNLVRLLADRGLAAPLDVLILNDPQFKSGAFSPAVAGAGRVNGVTYGLAFGVSMPVVLFNADLVKRAGGNPQSLPATWPALIELADKINRPESGVIGGFLEYDNGGAFSFLFLLQSQGGRFLQADDRNIAFDDPSGRAALNVLRDFGEAGQARADMTRDQARQAFAAGSIGIFVTMSSTIPRLERAAEGYFEVVSMPLPLGSPVGDVPAAGPVAVMLTHDPKRQVRAFEFLKFACGPAGQSALVEKSGYAPANESAIQASPALRAELAQRKNAQAYLKRLSVMTDWYAPPGPNAIKIGDLVSTNLQRVATLRATPEEAIRSMTQDIQPLLLR